jgi:hypothetical protein
MHVLRHPSRPRATHRSLFFRRGSLTSLQTMDWCVYRHAARSDSKGGRLLLLLLLLLLP